MFDLDEIDAELDRRRVEAQHKTARTRKIVKYVGGTILAVVIGFLVLFLGQYSDRISLKKGLLIVGIVIAVVALEAVVLRLNSKRNHPWSDMAVSMIFFLILFGVLTAVI